MIDFISTVPVPTVVLAAPPSSLFAGTSLELICTIYAGLPETTNYTVTASWERVRGLDSDCLKTVKLSHKPPWFRSTMNVIVTNLDREFTCRAIVVVGHSASPQGRSTQPVVVTSEWACMRRQVNQQADHFFILSFSPSYGDN